MEPKSAPQLKTMTEKMEKSTTVQGGVKGFLKGLAKELKKNARKPKEIEAIAAKLVQRKSGLAKAAVANTGVATKKATSAKPAAVLATSATVGVSTPVPVATRHVAALSHGPNTVVTPADNVAANLPTRATSAADSNDAALNSAPRSGLSSVSPAMRRASPASTSKASFTKSSAKGTGVGVTSSKSSSFKSSK